MQPINTQMIQLSYNGTGLTQFSIPLGSNITYQMLINDDITLFILKRRLDALNVTFLRYLHIPSSTQLSTSTTSTIMTTTLTEHNCNNTIYDRYFLLIIVGLILLIFFNIIVLIKQIYCKCSFKQKKTNENHSFHNHHHHHHPKPQQLNLSHHPNVNQHHNSNDGIPTQRLEFIPRPISIYSMK
jgi:hypothetical protein